MSHKMNHQIRLEIYFRYKSSSFIKYVELPTRDLFMNQYYELEVQKTIHLPNLAKKIVVKSNVLVVEASIKFDFLVRQSSILNKFQTCINDTNIIKTIEELPKTINCLKKEFEMKDLGRLKLCLGLQIEYLKNEFFLCASKNLYSKGTSKVVYRQIMYIVYSNGCKILLELKKMIKNYLVLKYYIVVLSEHSFIELIIHDLIYQLQSIY
ncbi:hypothetical protein CR513_36438, partial [Mucuna pruriens]